MTAETTAPQREHYRPSGRCRWRAFLPLAGVCLGASVFASALLYLALCLGVYIIWLVPVLLTLGVCALLYAAIHFGRCRNPVLGTGLGLTCGVLLYIGYFYVGMVCEGGPEFATRIEALPAYIAHRMATDVSHDPALPENARNQAPGAVDAVFNWLFFTLEFGTILVLTGGVGWARSRRAFCEACGTWMEQKIAALRSGAGATAQEALASGSLVALAGAPKGAIVPNQPYTAVCLEICAHWQPGTRDCPIYLSVKEVKSGGSLGNLQRFDAALGKTPVNRVRLATAETRSLVPLFPALANRVGTSPAEVLQEAVAPDTPPLPEEEVTSDRPTVTVTRLVPEGDRGLLTTRAVLLGNLYTMVPVAIVLGGIFVPLLLSLLIVPSDVPAKELELSSPQWAGVIALALLGIGTVGAGLYITLTDVSRWGTRYLQRLCRAALLARQDALVDPDAADALFVEIVPRENWGQIKLEDADDIGYLRLDPEGQQLLFEGGRERWALPGDAILDCSIEEFILGAGSPGATRRILLCLQARHPELPNWEICFTPRAGQGALGAGKRRKGLTVLRDAIRALAS